MSDVMLFGVLAMPNEMLEGSTLTRLQYYPRVREAVARLHAAEARVEELEQQLKSARRASGANMPSKPEWTDAPAFARHLAMDDDGQWFWHELLPVKHSGRWMSFGSVQYAGCIAGWDETLEARP